LPTAAKRTSRDDKLFNYPSRIVSNRLRKAQRVCVDRDLVDAGARPAWPGSVNAIDDAGRGGFVGAKNADQLAPESTGSVELGTKWMC